MGAKGFYMAQDGHAVNILPPVSITGGANAAIFDARFHAHTSIFISLGAATTPLSGIKVNACSTLAGANPVAIPFDLFACEVANSDLFGPRVPVVATGYTPANVADIMYEIELDAAVLPQGSTFVQLALAGGSAALASAVAVLSGARYAEGQSLTVLA